MNSVHSDICAEVSPDGSGERARGSVAPISLRNSSTASVCLVVTRAGPDDMNSTSSG